MSGAVLVVGYLKIQPADHLEVPSVLRHEREAGFDRRRGNQSVKGPQTVRFRVALEQFVRQPRNLHTEVPMHRISLYQAVDTVGIALVPGADDEFVRGDEEIVMSSRASTKFAAAAFLRDTSIITSVSIRYRPWRFRPCYPRGLFRSVFT